MFSCKICKIFKNTFLADYLRWLLLLLPDTPIYRFYGFYEHYAKFILQHSWRTTFNPFLVNVSILYLLKTPENLWFSDLFSGYKMGTLVRNELSGLHKYPFLGIFRNFQKSFFLKHHWTAACVGHNKDFVKNGQFGN